MRSVKRVLEHSYFRFIERIFCSPLYPVCQVSIFELFTRFPLSSISSADLASLQLFENQSVVEYWENFASHAFESTTQSVVSHCVLLKPNGAPVPCTFCFSIRRDIMDLPSIIIGEYFFHLDDQTILQVSHPSRFTAGQWLPLL
jgi:hypothetical protein